MRRASRKAGVSWHLHRLRHACATNLRKAAGIDAAKATLGHSTLAMAEHYAEIDEAHAIDAMKRHG